VAPSDFFRPKIVSASGADSLSTGCIVVAFEKRSGYGYPLPTGHRLITRLSAVQHSHTGQAVIWNTCFLATLREISKTVRTGEGWGLFAGWFIFLLFLSFLLFLLRKCVLNLLE